MTLVSQHSLYNLDCDDEGRAICVVTTPSYPSKYLFVAIGDRRASDRRPGMFVGGCTSWMVVGTSPSHSQS